MLCAYKNIFGKPDTGIHSLRLFNFAIVDVLGTIGIAYILTLFTTIRFPIALAGLFLLGIILHHVFCVRTTLEKILFP